MLALKPYFKLGDEIVRTVGLILKDKFQYHFSVYEKIDFHKIALGHRADDRCNGLPESKPVVSRSVSEDPVVPDVRREMDVYADVKG